MKVEVYFGLSGLFSNAILNSNSLRNMVWLIDMNHNVAAKTITSILPLLQLNCLKCLHCKSSFTLLFHIRA